MGSGVWSANTYQSRVSQRTNAGQDVFAYNQGARGVHPSLDPQGLEMRESRDSNEHPNSNSIIVGLDVSGSMGRVVRGIHKDLPQLFGLLLGHNYVPHPQILFAAFSNGRCDRVPLQVGQFESDNRMDQHFENMVMGGPLAGGCDPVESAELMFYLAARHTSIDCWEKRKHKGYLFLISDEPAYRAVKHEEIQKIIGTKLRENIPLEKIIAEAREKYHLFIVVPNNAAGAINTNVLEFWKSYLESQHVIPLNDPEDVSETIALTIGLTEHTIRLEDGLAHLKATGSSDRTINALAANLSAISGQAIKGTGSGLDDLENDQRKGTRRL